MNHEQFLDTAQSCWDCGNDPIGDPAVAAHLLACPEALEPFARWREAVAGVALAPTVRRWPWLAAAAVLLAGLAAGGLLTTGSAAARDAGAIVSSTFERTTRSPGHSVTWRERRVLVATPDTFFAITDQRSAPR